MSRQNLVFFRSKEQKEAFEEKELLQACLQGDSRAFEKIVEKYRDQIFWTAYHLVLDSEDARDVAQQSFLKVWKSLRTYQPERSFSGWISKITVHCAIDFLRSRRQTEPLPEMESDPPAIDRDLDLRRIFFRIAPLLSRRQRIVLVLREIYDWEISEIARVLHCTESTVRNLHSQAKDSFRKKVKELFPDYGL